MTPTNPLDGPPPPGKFAATVKVGPKGQVVIPKGARDLFGIAPGDTLLLLADKDRGIALMQQGLLDEIVEAAMPGPAGPPSGPPGHPPGVMPPASTPPASTSPEDPS